MNYQPYADMHVLVSDDLVEVISLLSQSLVIALAALIACVISYLVIFKKF